WSSPRIAMAARPAYDGGAANNAGSFLRRQVLPASVKRGTMALRRDKPIRTGAKVVCRARYGAFATAERIPRDGSRCDGPRECSATVWASFLQERAMKRGL